TASESSRNVKPSCSETIRRNGKRPTLIPCRAIIGPNVRRNVREVSASRKPSVSSAPGRGCSESCAAFFKESADSISSYLVLSYRGHADGGTNASEGTRGRTY